MQQRNPDRNRLADSFSDSCSGGLKAPRSPPSRRTSAGRRRPPRRKPWPPPSPYVSEALHGEAVLTVGAPLHEWRHRQIDAVVNVGPLECMPTKIAEAQFHHVAEREGLLSLTLPFNGDPVSAAALDNFAFEVQARFQRRKNGGRRLAHEPAAA